MIRIVSWDRCCDVKGQETIKTEKKEETNKGFRDKEYCIVLAKINLNEHQHGTYDKEKKIISLIFMNNFYLFEI